MLEERVQCGFVSIPTHESLMVWPLIKDRMLVIMPEGHPLSSRTRLNPLDLAEQEFIIPPEGLNYTVGKAFADAGLALRSKAIVDEDYSVLLWTKRTSVSLFCRRASSIPCPLTAGGRSLWEISTGHWALR